MATTKFYKTTDPNVLAAWKEYQKQVQATQDAGRAFADLFGATALYGSTAHGYEFRGITFKGKDPFMGKALWTKPERNTLDRQRPIKRVPASLKDESKTLRALWDENHPQIKADREPLLNSVGLDWGRVLFGGGFSFFELKGVAYFKTAAALTNPGDVTEITGSEYEAAIVAHDEDKKAA